MYVERIPNRNSPPAILLRESYRDGDKVKKRTLANLSDWPSAKIEALHRLLSQGGRQPHREVALCIAMAVARIIDPASKLATARVLDEETATCSLGQVIELGAVDRKSTRLNSSHGYISYAVFCLK